MWAILMMSSGGANIGFGGVENWVEEGYEILWVTLFLGYQSDFAYCFISCWRY